MKKLIILTTILCMVFFEMFAHGQHEKGTLTLQTEGSAPIKRGDVAAAREAAIKNALKEAILQATSKLLETPAQDENFQLIKSVILDEPDKYIFYYTIAHESRQQQNFIVRANVVVALLALKNDLRKMGFLHNQQFEENEIKIFLIVKGLRSYSEYSQMKKFLQKSKDLVKNIYPGRFQWQEASFEIELSGNAQYLADELEQNVGCVLEIRQPEYDKVEMICWK
ncbi:MAG TPA: hypothetical protein ENN23_06180 [Deltaproteobacteria bacterium]|mgnify:CR=1 FL=1|nr:hypothetical protein [Deltaproteobacteria bacterium]